MESIRHSYAGANRIKKAHLERITVMDPQALIVALSIGGAVLVAQGQASVAWVPYQIGCPILVVDLKTDANVHAPLFESVDVQNVSAHAVDEITVGVLAGSHASGIPRRLVASQTVTTHIAAGERRRLTLQLGVRADVPATARPEDFLITLGVVQVRDRSRAVWVSPVTISGEFKAVNWPSTRQAQSRHACVDERRRQYPPGAVVFDQRHVALICRPDGTWEPR
jgi:hypothetical protein